MKSFYIFLSLVFIFFFSNHSAFAQTKESNQKVVHKATDKMNYEFALAILKRINELDKNVKFSNPKLTDTTFTNVKQLKPRVQAESLDRIFSKEQLSDNVAGYIYDINFVKQSDKYYPTEDLVSSLKSLDKIEKKVLQRVKDFGEQQNKFKLTSKQYNNLKLRLTKIKKSAVSQLEPKEDKKLDGQNNIDSTNQIIKDSVDTHSRVSDEKRDSTKIIFYKINQEEEKQLIGKSETAEGEKQTYKFGLDIKNTDSIQVRVQGNSTLDTIFLAANINNSLTLEGQNNIYMIDLNVATTQEDDYIMWIIFLAIAAFVIVFVWYKQGQKKQSENPKEIKQEVIKKDPLSRNDVVAKTVIPTEKNTEDKERKTVVAQNQTQNQIEEEKKRLTAILNNSKLSDEQKLKEAKSENVIIEVANNAEVKGLMQKIEELSTKPKTTNTEKEVVKEQKIIQETPTPSKNIKNYHEPLYVSLSDIKDEGIQSQRKKGMSNTIFVIRPYSKRDAEAKEADFLLHSDIKDMAFESIFRSIEKLDHLIEHSTFTESAKKIVQEEKGKLIKENDVWKIKQRLKVKFS
ncbi:hypothetical protein WAF17_12910 [Bernardetia sp. ABR2-2B]|uniref:hypothetical protein n=1 Tax=Bernardetia sp. ABR2-2B TaxID=3127472 RepID=UPI0030CE548A